MWVIYLEMGIALALLILIVWWTWPAKRKQSAGTDAGAHGSPGAPKDDGPQ